MPTAGDWLAETKLSPPRPRQDVIQRDVLAAVLREALLTHRLTLLSAPAGYGKTTLLAAIPQLSPQVLFAWLTLDAEDNDPARCLLGIVAALRRLNPACRIDLESFTSNLPDLNTANRHIRCPFAAECNRMQSCIKSAEFRSKDHRDASLPSFDIFR